MSTVIHVKGLFYVFYVNKSHEKTKTNNVFVHDVKLKFQGEKDQ